MTKQKRSSGGGVLSNKKALMPVKPLELPEA
jgi:hypothetical protein